MHCAAADSLNHQTQLIIVEEAQKAARARGRGGIVSRRLGPSVFQSLARAAWQGRLTLDLAAPLFSAYSSRLVAIMK